MLRALRLGLTPKLAANLVGFNLDEFEQKCRDEPDFAKQVNKAVASHARRHIDRLEHHSQKHWMVSAWLLERLHPQDYANANTQLSVQTNIGTGPTNVVVLGPERAKELVNRHEAIRAKTIELLEHKNGDSNGNTTDSA
jgi:hypothetical protein